jgi:FAD/FMN-containing dehydrogenase
VPSARAADIAGLAGIVGAAQVLTDADLRASYEVDWTGRFRGECLAVVRPADTAEVAAVVRWCRAHKVAVVPQGGNTSLVGGAVPPAGSIVLSTRRLSSIGEVDRLAGQLTAGAGATLADVHAAVAGTGWAFGVDLGARDSCTIGGMVATNAGGIRVLRHGTMRAQVLGLEAVLADGSIVRHLSGLVKDNTGYDLPGLLTGSEGTLGIVTNVRLRLVPDPPDRVTVLAGLASVAEAVALSARLRAEVDGLDAVEAVLGDGLALVCAELGYEAPLPTMPAVTVLVEWAGRGDPPASFADALDGLETVAAADRAGRARLWRYREEMATAIARVGVPHKLDVTLPVAELAVFCADVAPLVQSVATGARTHLFGHLGDGNIHVNVTGVAPEDERVDAAVLRTVVARGGSISAEHGVGRAKAGWLSLQRSPEELRMMRALKQALDPVGILNPGCLLA